MDEFIIENKWCDVYQMWCSDVSGEIDEPDCNCECEDCLSCSEIEEE